MYDTGANVYEIGKILQRIEKQNKQIIDLLKKTLEVKNCTSLTVNCDNKCDSTEFAETIKSKLSETMTNLNFNH